GFAGQIQRISADTRSGEQGQDTDKLADQIARMHSNRGF
ncbi:unnamed protein product, partial [marine sediment metagenome]